MPFEIADKAAIEKRFHTLAKQWKAACAFSSSTSEMVAHPSYQAIIEMGQPVVPLLLQELEKAPVHWFEALKAITGEDPVPIEDWGKIPAMTFAWLAWGRSRNSI